MLQVRELSDTEIVEILSRVGYGHLACSRDDRPYVVPIHYAYSEGVVYLYTTEGKKVEIIRTNPHVCLQVEEVEDNQDWNSVIVEGTAEEITDSDQREKAIAMVVDVNPTLTPAVVVRWMDDWVRENIPVVYRVTVDFSSGRGTVDPG